MPEEGRVVVTCDRYDGRLYVIVHFKSTDECFSRLFNVRTADVALRHGVVVMTDDCATTRKMSLWGELRQVLENYVGRRKEKLSVTSRHDSGLHPHWVVGIDDTFCTWDVPC